VTKVIRFTSALVFFVFKDLIGTPGHGSQLVGNGVRSRSVASAQSGVDESKMPDVDLASSSGIVDVQQQRLNCALPSHFSELWFLSIPKSLRHVRGYQLIHPRI
jgi:hypothetical protein